MRRQQETQEANNTKTTNRRFERHWPYHLLMTHRKIDVRLKTPPIEILSRCFLFGLGPNTSQNRRVSSAAALTTLVPSGLCSI